MKDNNDSRTRKVRKCARPINIRNGNRRAVLCIHGFTGYPGEMAYPASRLAESKWDVLVPRLTGHGTDGRDFAPIGPAEWMRQLDDEWLNLNAEYDEVCVLGHSLGGLLALSLARKHDISKVAVMAPAIGIRTKGQCLLRPISWVIRKKSFPWKSDPKYSFFDERDDDDDEYLGAEYWSWIWFRQLAELQSLMKKTEKGLSDISSPVLGIFGDKDTVTGTGGSEMMKKCLKAPFEALHIAESGHYIPYEYTEGVKEQAMDAVILWFRG